MLALAFAQPVRVLTRDVPLTEPVAGGDQVALRFDVPAGFYSRIVIEPSGVRLSYRLSGPGGKMIASGLVWRGRAVGVSLVAASGGTHTLTLSCDDEPRYAGAAIVRLAALRPEERQDADRLRASALEAEAGRLREKYVREHSERARELYEEAGSVWEGIGEEAAAARAYRDAGILYRDIGEWDKALQAFDKAVELARNTGDQALTSELLSWAGLAQALLGAHDEGLARCRSALAIARSIRARRQEGEALHCIAEVDYHRGNQQLALEPYFRAVELQEQIGDRWGLAETLLHLASATSELDNHDRAAEHYRRSMGLWRGLANRRGEMLALIGMGWLNLRIGEYQAGLNFFSQAEPALEAIGDRLWLASLSAGIAKVYGRMGREHDAAKRWDRAVGQIFETGVGLAKGDVLQAAGESHLKIGDLDRALELFRGACRVGREIGNDLLLAHGLRFIGLVYNARGDSAEALRYFERSLALCHEPGRARLQSYALADAGDAYLHLGNLAAARSRYEQAIELSAAARDSRGESVTRYRLARALAREGDLTAARRQVEQSLRIAERMRRGVSSYNLRATYFASIHDRHELYIDILMRLGRGDSEQKFAAAALEASERARARSLLDSLSDAGVDLERGLPPELLARRKALKQTIDAKAEQLMRLASAGTDKKGAAALESEIHELDNRFDQLDAEIRSRSPHYAALAQPDPLSLPDIQRQVLDEDSVLLEYSLGRDRSYLWAVTSSAITGYTLPPRARIEAQARRVYRLLTARMPIEGESVRAYRGRVKQADRNYWPEAAKLSETLIKPVAGLLGDKRLLVVADGALQFLPFGALPAPGNSAASEPLLLGHEIVNLPSASALAILRRESEGRPAAKMDLAVFADPVFSSDDPRLLRLAGKTREPAAIRKSGERSVALLRSLRQVGFTADNQLRIPRLPATRKEAATITGFAPPGRSFEATDFSANLDTVHDAGLERYRIVHFATHGVVNSDNPGLSGILLSMFDKQGRARDGFLRLGDIYNLDLPVELVVLSACSSALGQQIRGEGLVGLVRGFMHAGARRVVASLWKVDDEATGELMRRFYEGIFRRSLSPAAALRRAQMQMWRESEWKSPYFWAAFVLQGEWK